MRLKRHAQSEYVERVQSGGKAQDVNRACWISAWETCSKEGGMLKEGDEVLTWYLGWCRSSCSVERLLGDSASEGKRRVNLSAHHLGNSVTVRRFGPTNKEELATRVVIGDQLVLKPKAHLTACQQKWIQRFGRRFQCIGKTRKDKGISRPLRRHSRRWFKQERRNGIEKMVGDQRASSEIKFVLNPSKSLRGFRWIPSSDSCKLTDKMKKTLARFEQKQAVRLKEEAKRPLNGAKKRSHFAMLPAEMLKQSVKKQRQDEKQRGAMEATATLTTARSVYLCI